MHILIVPSGIEQRRPTDFLLYQLGLRADRVLTAVHDRLHGITAEREINDTLRLTERIGRGIYQLIGIILRHVLGLCAHLTGDKTEEEQQRGGKGNDNRGEHEAQAGAQQRLFGLVLTHLLGVLHRVSLPFLCIISHFSMKRQGYFCFL